MTASTVQLARAAPPPLRLIPTPATLGASPIVGLPTGGGGADFYSPGPGPADRAPAASAGGDQPSRDEAKAALGRLLASATFRHSGRHRAFLRYVVDATLDDRARALKEVVIGLDVFERKLDRFDPRRDSIVRVEARRLRKKLRIYYDGEGRHDPVEIRLNVGGYVPLFVYRERPRDVSAATPLVLVIPFVSNGDGHAEVVAAGLCDQLTDGLAAVAGIRVMATMAASQVGPVVDGWDRLVVPENLDYVVGGSLTRLASRWRCIAHLTSMRDGTRRWSRSLDFGPRDGESTGDVDLFALRDCITDALCAAMRVELGRVD